MSATSQILGAAAHRQVLPWERPLGARLLGDGTAEFRVWAPAAEEITLILAGQEHALEDAGEGVRTARVPAQAGDDYAFRVGGSELPDPCSRWQPQGIRGPSRITDPAGFAWSDSGWRGVPLSELVIYELHVGTFTADGTFDAAIEDLPRLRDLGITAIELMPVASFPGRRGWGYDGVYLWAPQEPYGGPDGLRRFIDAAHVHGIAVILDVVYNHVGASGEKALRAFGPYFTDRYSTFWGAAVNYDDEDCGAVREWVIQNACHWISEYHVDGLRLDAIHAIYDSSATHVLAELAARVHAQAPGALVISESGLNDPKVIRPADAGGWGHDGQWADDFHHALRTLVTEERDGYYADFGEVAQLAKAFHRPFVHDGGWSQFRRRRFGAPADDRAPHQFVVFSQNHDQVGNRAFGDRMPPEARPLAAFCTLLAPFVPMLFMGEEYGEEAPFQFFSDHIDPDIATATREGRRREFASFASFGEEVPDPQDEATFRASKLTRRGDEALASLYRDLIALRRSLPAGEAHADFDEEERWVRVRRGGLELALNFAAEPRTVVVSGSEIVLAAGQAELQDGTVVLEPLSGAAIR